MIASSRCTESQSTRVTMNRIERMRSSAVDQYARKASLPRTIGDPITASAVGLVKMMSSRKWASTASRSRRFHAAAHSAANFSASLCVEIMAKPLAHEEEKRQAAGHADQTRGGD